MLPCLQRQINLGNATKYQYDEKRIRMLFFRLVHEEIAKEKGEWDGKYKGHVLLRFA